MPQSFHKHYRLKLGEGQINAFAPPPPTLPDKSSCSTRVQKDDQAAVHDLSAWTWDRGSCTCT